MSDSTECLNLESRYPDFSSRRQVRRAGQPDGVSHEDADTRRGTALCIVLRALVSSCDSTGTVNAHKKSPTRRPGSSVLRAGNVPPFHFFENDRMPVLVPFLGAGVVQASPRSQADFFHHVDQAGGVQELVFAGCISVHGNLSPERDGTPAAGRRPQVGLPRNPPYPDSPDDLKSGGSDQRNHGLFVVDAFSANRRRHSDPPFRISTPCVRKSVMVSGLIGRIRDSRQSVPGRIRRFPAITAGWSVDFRLPLTFSCSTCRPLSRIPETEWSAQ